MGENTIENNDFFFYNGTKCSVGEYLGAELERVYSSLGADSAERYIWRDGGWRAYAERTSGHISHLPLNIYELELSLWKRFDSDTILASELATYVKQMGYTHICPRDALEHSGADALKPFVDQMHEAGIGVILVCRFDNTTLDNEKALISYALACLDIFHADGLKISAAYLPKWLTDKSPQDRTNFFSMLSLTLRASFPTALLIAEGIDLGGENCDFDFECDLPRMRALLDYLAEDSLFRKHHHEKITLFSKDCEKTVFPISDADGRSLCNTVSGDRWQRFAASRAALAYQMTTPSKKLCFMGTELSLGGDGTIDWSALKDEAHARFQLYVAELNNLYLENSPLWQLDGRQEGFAWIESCDRERSIISYRRTDKSGRELIVVINFTPVVRENYLLGVPCSGEYEEIFNSDSEKFGGGGVLNRGTLVSSGMSQNSLPDSVRMRVPPLGATVLRRKNS
ncbi:MAG: alpha amylase C-terminal domain-containing protein [Clostridia bacterium]|nr:alpha amylase C-terminal domain-containing protein [Clostridia bacterium]